MTTAAPFRRRLAAARRRLTGAAVLRGLLWMVAGVGAAVAMALVAEAALWMGVGLRTLVAWTLAALAVGLAAWGMGTPLLRAAGVLPGLDERAVARRTGEDFAGVGDRLTALLDLADGHGSAAPDRLRAAALDALAAEVAAVPFERVRVADSLRTVAPWAAVPLAVLALAFAVAPGTAGAAARRLMAPGTVFLPPAPFALVVAPGDTAVSRGEPLLVRAEARGRELPLVATLEVGRVGERAVETVRLARQPDGGWAHTVAAVQADLRYRVVADGVASRWFTARVENRPVVRGLRVVVAPPAYAGRPARALPEGVGDVTGLAGSTVRVRVGLGGTPAVRGWLALTWDGRPTVRVPLQLSAGQGAAAFRLAGPGRYSVHLVSAAGRRNASPAEYALGTLADTPPQIVLTEGADADLSPAARRIGFRVSDDFGFGGAQLVWRLAARAGGGAGPWRSVALPLRARPLDQATAVVWRLPGARPGDAVELYGRVRDNGPFGHTARTATVTLRYPSLGERLDAFTAERDSASQALDAMGSAARAAADRSQRLRESLQRNPTPDWESRRQVEERLREQDALRDEAQEMQRRMEELARQAGADGTMDPSTERLLEQMQGVMQELDVPELRDALQRLQEAMERLDLRQMLDASQQVENLEQQLQQRLQRAMELMERLEAAVEMQSAARRADDLAERQERAAREAERLAGEQRPDPDRESGQERESDGDEADDGSPPNEGRQTDDEATTPPERTPEAERARQEAQQRRAAEEAAALERQLEELRQRLDEMRGSPTAPADEALQQMQQNGGLPQQMEQSADDIRENRPQEAAEQMREAARRFRRMAQQMQQAAASAQSQRRRVDAAALRRALEDVLTLSQRQEALAGETGRTPAGNPALVGQGRRQRDLSDGFRAVVDTLQRVGRSVPELGAAVQTRATNAGAELDRALAALAARESPQAAAAQRMAMSHLNELALLLAQVLDEMEQSPSGGSGGGGEPQQQMQQMGEAQSRLNQRIQQMLNDAAGQRLSGDGGRRMRQLAEQQEALRRQLEGLARDGSLDAAQRSALQRLAEQMREAAAELRSGRATLRALPRQQQIHERMLEAQRSMNQRGREERREGESARSAATPPPAPAPAPSPGRAADRIRADLIRALESGYSADYQDLIKRYFDRLQRRYAD